MRVGPGGVIHIRNGGSRGTPAGACRAEAPLPAGRIPQRQRRVWCRHCGHQYEPDGGKRSRSCQRQGEDDGVPARLRMRAETAPNGRPERATTSGRVAARLSEPWPESDGARGARLPLRAAPQNPGNDRNPLSISLNRLSNMRREGGRRKRRCGRMGGETRHCSWVLDRPQPALRGLRAGRLSRVASYKMIPKISSRIDLAVRARWS